jgi:hypothetical protein
MVSDNNEAKTLFDDFVTKPVSQNQIYGKLRKFLPYWQKDVIRTGEQDNDSITEGLTEGDHAKLIEKLEYDLMMEWNEIKDNLVIYRIEDFLEKLDSLNEKFSIKIIQNYYEELKSCVNNFEIERMENKIQEFPEIVEKIKST